MTAQPRTAKELLVWLHYGPDVGDLHPEDRAAAENLVDAIEANGWRLVQADQLALQGHIDHGAVLVERDLLRDALRHVLAAARDVDRNTRDVHTSRCDDCDQLPDEGHDDDCGMDPLASACDYAVALLRGRVVFEATNAHDTPEQVRAAGWIAPTSVGGSE